MASLTIRQLDERLKQRLRVRAARNGRSIDEEARARLRSALAASQTPKDLAESIRQKLAAVGGGVELELPKREAIREPPDFSE